MNGKYSQSGSSGSTDVADVRQPDFLVQWPTLPLDDAYQHLTVDRDSSLNER